MSIDELAVLAGGLPNSARCLNPDCRRKCPRRPGKQGRQKLFCRDSCRLSYFRERQSLLSAWAKIDAAAAAAAGRGPVSGRELRKMQRWLEWLLIRYGVDDPSKAHGA
jgi:hypothetical protein